MDSNGWRQAGCEGWRCEDILPYFKRMENYNAGGDAFRGSGRSLSIHKASFSSTLLKVFIAADEEAGDLLSDNLYGYRQEGFWCLRQHYS